MACSNAGLPVTLRDTSQGAIDVAIAAIRKTYESSVQRGRLTPKVAQERQERIRVH